MQLGVIRMLSNCNYDKAKLLARMSKLQGFIEKHAIKIDAERDGHPLCAEEYKELGQDLNKHIEKLRGVVRELGKEGKF